MTQIYTAVNNSLKKEIGEYKFKGIVHKKNELFLKYLFCSAEKNMVNHADLEWHESE